MQSKAQGVQGFPFDEGARCGKLPGNDSTISAEKLIWKIFC
jgi:hypothetical protein